MNKKHIIVTAVIAIALIGIGILLAKYGNKPIENMAPTSFTGSDEEVVSEQGIHYGPKLSITVRGKNIEIPANVGMGAEYSQSRFYDSMMSMTNVHTHDASGELHWEVMEGPVKKGHVKLSVFFEIWGQPFNANQILEYTKSETEKITMTVNGQPNTDFENYIVKDGDKIEITLN